MASKPLEMVDDYPSMLWVAIPSALLVSAFFVRKWYLSYRLKNYGIGKGAPGFQTNVRRVRVTPEIAARIRRGEEVSPEEIAAASAKMDEMERLGKVAPAAAAPRPPPPTFEDEKPFLDSRSPRPPSPPAPVNEWLPDTLTNPTKRKKGKRR